MSPNLRVYPLQRIWNHMVSMEVVNKGKSARHLRVGMRLEAQPRTLGLSGRFLEKLLAPDLFFSRVPTDSRQSPHHLRLSLCLFSFYPFVSSFSTLANVVGFVKVTPAAIAKTFAKTLITKKKADAWVSSRYLLPHKPRQSQTHSHRPRSKTYSCLLCCLLVQSRISTCRLFPFALDTVLLSSRSPS